MRARLVVPLLALALIGAGLLAVPAVRTRLATLGARARSTVGLGGAPGYGLKQAAQPPAPPPALHAAPVTITTRTAFLGWALLDRDTGAIAGSANLATGRNTTESMIKAWIVSDYLRTHPDASAAAQRELTLAIVDSNDDMAQKYYRLDGGNAVVRRMIRICGLTRTSVKSGWWSMTQLTPQDAVRYGACVADGRAAGPKWTAWVLATMRHVSGGVDDQPVNQKTGGGRWGIIDGLPASLAGQVSIKNGWTFIYADDLWHVNCLAILPASVLAVLIRYRGPVSPNGLRTGADICASVTRQLVYTGDV
jgi:hypothetical protein